MMKFAKSRVTLIRSPEMWDEFFNPTANPTTSFYRGFFIGLCKAVLLLSMFTSCSLAGMQFVYTLGWLLKFFERRGYSAAPYTWWFNGPANGISGSTCLAGFILFVALIVCLVALARFGGWSVKK